MSLNQYSRKWMGLKMPLIVFCCCLAFSGIAQDIQVQISNTPGFYYSHTCDMYFTVISQAFFNYSLKGSQSFMISLLETAGQARFLDRFIETSIVFPDQTVIRQHDQNYCTQNRSITTTFSCTDIISHGGVWPEVKYRYNQTHGMYKFKLRNIVCPRSAKGIGQSNYHIKFELAMAYNATITKLSKIFTYKFKGLKYRIIDKIITNSVQDKDGKPILESNGTQISALKYLIKNYGNLTISVTIPNQTQSNYWENVILHFIGDLKTVVFNLSMCQLQTSYEDMELLQYYVSNYTVVPCEYSEINKTLTFSNPNYINNSFMLNQAFNLFQIFNSSSIRYRFRVEIKFTEQTQVQFGYRVTATTSLQIGDDGKLSNISTTNAVLYDSLDTPETLYGLNQSEYDKLDPKYRVPVLVSPSQSGSFSSNDGFMSDFFGKLTTISNLPLLAVVAILLLAMLLVCTRKELWKLEKYLFLLFVLSDLFVKVAIIATINALAETDALYVSNKEVSFMLSVFLVVQYCGFGLVLFFTYWLYILSTQQHSATDLGKQTSKISQKQQEKPQEKSSKKNKALVVLAMLFNYKFYCVCLFDLQVGKDLKLRRFRNDQLYVKFCWHLGIEVALILVQIFCVMSSCTYIPVSVVFGVHQGVYALLMTVVGKAVFRILTVKKLKKKVREICSNKVRNQQSNHKQNQQNTKNLHINLQKELQKYSKKFERRNQNQDNENDFETQRRL